ncbi:MAG: alpha/beta fold hydrolase [Methyloligella sp. ZOD6]
MIAFSGRPMELISTPQNPAPLGATVGALEIPRRFRRPLQVRYAHWPSGLKERHGTVCIFPGRTEFIEKYFEVVGELRRRGFYVVAIDWRGQGGSTRLTRNPLKGHVRRFDDYQADLSRLMNDVVLPDCPPPYYVLAHSMGGAIALKAATMRGSWFERMVLTAPMIRIQGLPFSDVMTTKATGLVSKLGFGRLAVPGGAKAYRQSQIFEDNILTTDAERFARNLSVLKAAPELAVGTPTFGWVHAALTAMREINDQEFPRRLRVPVVMLAAGNDRIVSNGAIETFADHFRLGSQIVLRGSEHEILQERDPIRQEFWAAFDAFVPGAKLKRSA